MAAKKASATRRLTPLELDALEGRRFDDLVMQLAYGFRCWKSLQPVDTRRGDPLDLVAIETVGDGVESTVLERNWRIVTKRGRSLTPKSIRQAVQGAVPDPARAPHGLIVGVSAPVTKTAAAAFHDEASKARVREAHLWSKASIEEMLLRPENDALLFTYFGIALRQRRMTRLDELRHHVAIKQRLMEAFGVSGAGKDIGHHDVLVRSTTDTSFPETAYGTGPRRSWHFARTFSLAHDRLGLELEDWLGVRRADGRWDTDEATSVTREKPNAVVREDPEWVKRSHERSLLERSIPEEERARVIGVGWIPLDRIALIDPMGTPGEGVPYLYCDFGTETGPYTSFSKIAYTRGWPAYLEEHMRDRSIFERLRATADLSESAYLEYQKALFAG